jgi:hypothetical protein
MAYALHIVHENMNVVLNYVKIILKTSKKRNNFELYRNRIYLFILTSERFEW